MASQPGEAGLLTLLDAHITQDVDHSMEEEDRRDASPQAPSSGGPKEAGISVGSVLPADLSLNIHDTPVSELDTPQAFSREEDAQRQDGILASREYPETDREKGESSSVEDATLRAQFSSHNDPSGAPPRLGASACFEKSCLEHGLSTAGHSVSPASKVEPGEHEIGHGMEPTDIDSMETFANDVPELSTVEGAEPRAFDRTDELGLPSVRAAADGADAEEPSTHDKARTEPLILAGEVSGSVRDHSVSPVVDGVEVETCVSAAPLTEQLGPVPAVSLVVPEGLIRTAPRVGAVELGTGTVYASPERRSRFGSERTQSLRGDPRRTLSFAAIPITSHGAQGTLLRSGRLGRHSAYHFRLQGVVLSQYRNSESTQEIARYCIWNTRVEGKASRRTIRLPQHGLVLVANDDIEWELWIEKIRTAASRCINDHYILNEANVLGRGTFGKVFEAVERGTTNRVAIKVISKRSVTSEAQLLRLSCEASLAVTIRHPAVVTHHDVFETSDSLYLVMEKMQGSLENYIRRTSGKLGERIIRKIICSILDALIELHRRNIVHRDIKPDNVLYKNDLETWKITDFGLGTFVLSTNQENIDTQLTETIGTSHYLAPEIVMKESYGRPVDVWACGVICYQMLCGSLPFEGTTIGDVIRSIRNGPPLFSDDEWDEVPPLAKKFVRDLLNRDPRSRLTALEARNHPWLNVENVKSEVNGSHLPGLALSPSVLILEKLLRRPSLIDGFHNQRSIRFFGDENVDDDFGSAHSSFSSVTVEESFVSTRKPSRMLSMLRMPSMISRPRLASQVNFHDDMVFIQEPRPESSEEFKTPASEKVSMVSSEQDPPLPIKPTVWTKLRSISGKIVSGRSRRRGSGQMPPLEKRSLSRLGKKTF